MAAILETSLQNLPRLKQNALFFSILPGYVFLLFSGLWQFNFVKRQMQHLDS